MGEHPSDLILESLLKRLAAMEQEVVRLQVENAALRVENEALKAENERLGQELAAAKKNSRNSSKPPSSDIVKPPSSKKSSKRRHTGGQPGHEPHFRIPFDPEQLDEIELFNPPAMACRHCGGELLPTPVADQVRQQIDLRPDPLIRREYRAPAYRCAECGTFHREKLPENVANTDFVGDNLAAAMAFLNVQGHASYSTIAAFMKDVMGEPLSRGQIAKTFRRVSAALAAPYHEALARLREEPALNIDETGHREKGKRFWTWVFRAVTFAVFLIDKTRSAEVLVRVLGSAYSGTIGCDYYSAYHKYLRNSGGPVQFCLAHLIRELRFLREHQNPEVKKYATRSLAAMKRLFRLYHRLLDKPKEERRELAKAGEVLWRTIVRAPPEQKAENIAKRFLDLRDPYLTFISNPQVEPTNNRAEQAIRQVVIDRASSQGTRGENGRAYKERMWTVLTTCAMRGASAYDFLRKALSSYAESSKAPSLLEG